ncbi:MAG: hypothetical protein ACI4PG_02110, partial [Candidatus Ventricola sp.]
MIIGMRGHDFGRMEPAQLASEIASVGFRATQLAFGKAFPPREDGYLTDEALSSIRHAFDGIALPVMGCYVSASDRDPAVLNAAKAKFSAHLRA